MIKVMVEKEDTSFKKIRITGHANYEEEGKDIVCASVSSMIITTINAILSFDKEAIFYEENVGLVKIEVKKNSQIVETLLHNLLQLLKDLEKEYPKNIKIKEG